MWFSLIFVLLFSLPAHAAVGLSPCDAVAFPPLPDGYVPVREEKLQSKSFLELCQSMVMPWCERAWVNRAHPGTVILMGSQRLDGEAVRRAGRARFFKAVRGIAEELKPRYGVKGMRADSKIAETPDGAFLAGVTITYPHEGVSYTDDRTYFFYSPDCRVDLLVSGPTTEAQVVASDLVAPVERYRAALAGFFSKGLGLSELPWFEPGTLLWLVGLWIVGLSAAGLLSRGRLPSDRGARRLKLGLAVAAIVLAAFATLTARPTATCLSSRGLYCADGVPASFDGICFALLTFLLACAGMATRDKKRIAQAGLGVALDLAALLFYLVFSGS